MQVGQGPAEQRAGMGEGPEPGLVATTLRVVYGYLNSVSASAVRDRLIASSPCIDIRLPGIDRGKRVIPSPEQVHRLAELMPPRPVGRGVCGGQVDAALGTREAAATSAPSRL